jgi:hypothetical protein
VGGCPCEPGHDVAVLLLDIRHACGMWPSAVLLLEEGDVIFFRNKLRFFIILFSFSDPERSWSPDTGIERLWSLFRIVRA